MSLTQVATLAVERAPIPDALTRLGVAYLVGRARRQLRATPADVDAAFARDMPTRPIAENTADANAQHYEVPAAFFRLVLGPRLKYSSCFYDGAATTLAQAEDRALAETCVHADMADGQDVLELGCGWGSLSLWMAERYPRSAIVSVSNSRSQRAAIEAEAKARGLANLTIITADMNDFQTQARFDRIVSVEMFEHMSNWRGLLARAALWLKSDGRLFLHVFTHKDRPYRFEAADRDDWIAQHFFTGGIMPSHGLIRQFPDLFEVEAEWRWSGDHYRRTANHWLANFDRNAAAVAAVLRETYGRDADLWRRRWRLFFLATAGLFGDQGGDVWDVSHYRLKAPAGAQASETA
ncbi:MAG: cyclopropane-fatty-acyl-phospholipid synthase family protein [Caulobacteraceae bacterium]